MKTSQGLSALRASARLTFTAIAASTLSFPTFAEEHFDTLTVTANRMPSENMLAPTTIVTRADIERLQINDLPTLLSRQPGIDLSVSGGLGKTTDIFMRGTSAGHVLVLVDGVKWSSATKGTAAFQHFPVEQIERVEIVRGPRSGLYGSEAIGGVIHIFTRQGQQGFSPYAKVSYGTHNTRQVAAGISGGTQTTTYNLSLNHQATNGINAIKHHSDDDDDSYRNNSISAKLQHQFNDAFDVGLNFTRTEGSSLFDGYYFKGHSVQQVLGIDSSYRVNDRWVVKTQLSESRDKLESFKSGGSDFYNTRHTFATLNNIIDLSNDQQLNVGFDYDLDDVDSSKEYDETSRYNRAVFVAWQGSYDKHSWLLSGRHDDNETFGTHNTTTAEWGYWLQENLQITANYGTAFKAPTFNQLYWPGAGDPNLLPEESKSYGIGLRGNHADVDWGISAYHNKIKNLISNWPPENVNKAKIKGIEFDIATTLAGWNIAANASFLKPEDEETGNILALRTQRMANIHIDKQWGAWSAGASWKLSGHRYDDRDNEERLGGFGLVDLRAAYQVAKDWSLQANVSNLFDKEYQTNDGYNSLDRVAMFTVLYQPK